MSGDLLQTKLYMPRLRPSLIPRPHLIKKLNAGLDGKLTLISAPAGFGKTTLASAWVQQIKHPIAWLSLDESDNDLTRFLTYFVAALQTIESNIGKGVLTALQSSGGGNVEIILTTLLNEITEFPNDVVLILDDYHVIESQPIDRAIIFLLNHLPPQLHLVIVSRIDPSLPLSRLRARGQMIEIRAHDLRFAFDETAVFLNQMMNFDLSAQEIADLELHTEGWIAGLQLAALSMKSLKGRSEIIDFIDNFTGSDRYIQDYLADEVLQQQPPATKEFLLQTSILNRLSSSLCDAVRFGVADTPSRSKGTAVTEQKESQAILESLEAANLFIVPLDNERHWYRYHHLFADLLRQRLRQVYPEQIPMLHGRASKWYEQNGLPSDAIRHALAVEDFKRVAGLAELLWPTIDGNLQCTQWLGWVKVLPNELVRVRPVLCVGYASTLLMVGELEAAETRLRDAERWLDMTADMSEQMVVIDEAQFRSLPASIAIARAYLAQATGDVPGTVKYARRVLDHLPEEENHLSRGQATALLGLASWTSGDLETARLAFAKLIAMIRTVGNIPDAINATFVLADIKIAQGHLHEAFNTYQQALQLAADQGEPMPLGTEDLYRGISELYRERGDLEAAAQHLLTGKKLGEQDSQSDWQHRLCVAQARLKEAQGDLDGALDLLDEAERLSIRNPLPDVRPIAALKTRIWVSQGRLAEALGWTRERGLSVDDDLSYLREFEYVTLARILIAQYKRDRVVGSIHEAMGLLERLLQAAEAGRRTGSMIEILVLQALAHEAQGDTSSALVSLEHALTLAEPEGYVRIFVDEGLPMAKLLHEATNQRIKPDYICKLLVAFGPNIQSDTIVPSQPLVEPLSERELEVLQLIAQGLTNRGIGERLFLALDTVKGHNRKIYGKLGVKNRTQAVKKVISLKILPPQ